MPAISRANLSDSEAAPLDSEARILAIDPGLDAAGLAVFSLAGYDGSSDVTALARAFVHVETARTNAGDPLPDRLAHLDGAVTQCCERFRPARIYIEHPRIAGTYRRNRLTTGRDGMAAQMAKLHMAMGALIAAAHDYAPVTMVPAPAMRKDDRHLLAVSILRHHEQRTRPGAKATRLPSKDALDAVWLGAQQLTGEIAYAIRRRRRA